MSEEFVCEYCKEKGVKRAYKNIQSLKDHINANHWKEVKKI